MSDSVASLPLRGKLAYASASLGGEALTQSRGLWLLYFYAPPDDADLRPLLPVLLAGAIIFAGRIFDALDDPLIGFWSDRTRSRLGRRLPFILGATPLWALFAVLLFTPPRHGTALVALYLFLVLELFSVFSTLSGGPYEALLPEIARTSRDRLSVVGLKVYFGAAGAGIGLAASGLLVDHVGFREMAIVMAVLALVFRYVGAAGIWRHASRVQPPAEVPFRLALQLTLQNRSFQRFLPSFVLFQVGFQMLLGVLPYYVNAILGVEEEGTWVAALSAVAVCAMLAAVPVFARLAHRRSKRHAYGRAMLGASVLFPLVAFAGLAPGTPDSAQLVVLMAVVGIPLAGVYLFPATLTADIVDDDSLRTGMRREAIYYGSQNFVEKTAGSLAPLLLAGLLLLGDTADDPLGIRLVGPVAGLVVLLGYLPFRRYDLPDDVLAATPSASAIAPSTPERRPRAGGTR
jgi:GPH family glycoside/pentoside/hexuronide:cation symporter